MTPNPHRDVADAAAHLARYLSRMALADAKYGRRDVAARLWTHAHWYLDWARSRRDMADALDDRHDH